jgi:hypothetical protein
MLFSAALGLVLLYPALSLVVGHKRKALKIRVAADHCPKCGEVFGPSITRTIREIRGFTDPAPTGPFLRIVCPHCHVAWDYCDGSFTLSSI